MATSALTASPEVTDIYNFLVADPSEEIVWMKQKLVIESPKVRIYRFLDQ